MTRYQDTSKDAMEAASIVISLLALGVSGLTAWLTLFRRGTIRMTQPTLVFFGPDGPGGGPKVFLRTNEDKECGTVLRLGP